MPEILTESFCERCGTRYTFESAAPRAARLKGIKVLSRGLKNFVLSDDTSMDEAMAAARSETDREVTSQQLDAFHKTFNFCMTCRQYTCGNCWNEAEGRCLSCAPHLGHEILPAPFPDLDPQGLAFGGAVAATNGNHEGNGHAPQDQATDTLAWPTMDLDRSTDDEVDIEPIDAVARLSFLSAVTTDDEELPETGIDAAAAESEAALETEAPATDPAIVDEAVPEVVADAAVESAVVADAPVDAEVAPVVEPDAVDDRAAAAATQTNDLMRRFRPGQSLDDEIAAYEQEQASAAAAAGAVASDRRADEADEPIVDLPVAAMTAAFVAHEVIADEPELADRRVGRTRRGRTAGRRGRSSPRRRNRQPRARRGRTRRRRRAADLADRRPRDRAHAPTGDPDGTDRRSLPTPAAATAEPQWPTQPEWPSQRPAAGLPFLARPAPPTGGMEALWAESAREVASPAAPVGGRRQGRRRRPAVRQLRAVTVSDRPVLSALRDPPGLSPPPSRPAAQPVIRGPGPRPRRTAAPGT